MSEKYARVQLFFVAQGYEILKVHEIWHLPQSSNTLFNIFLKIKLTDSWPADVGDGEEKRREYIQIMKPKKGPLGLFDMVAARWNPSQN